MVRAPGISRRFFFPWNVVSDQDFVNAEIQCGLQSRSITQNVRVHAARVRSLLDYVIDNGQLEYDWGNSPRQKPDAPFEPGLVFGNDPTNHCHGPHRRQTGNWSEVGKYSLRNRLTEMPECDN
jgi:hypothetical protein